MNSDYIGDNPNIIFPYQILMLDQSEFEPESYLSITLVVQPGESLWSIANDVYGDPLAWSILWFDNKNILGENFDVLKPGSVLRIRSKL